jgi:phage major head subunit gpT-like protein
MKRFLSTGFTLALMAILVVALAVAAFAGMASMPATAHPLDLSLRLGGDELFGLAFAGMIINRGTLSAFFTGLKTVYNNAFAKVETYFEQYSMRVPSSTAQEQYGWMGMIPGLREWIGDRQLANIRTYDFTLKNKSWERTLTANKDHIADDQIGIYTPMATALALEAKRHPQELVDGLLINGFVNLCYDGQPFFNANHPTYNDDGSVTLVSNNGGGAANPWFLIDDTRGVMPFIFQVRQDPNFVQMFDEDDERVFMAKEYRYGVDWRGNVGYGLWQLAYGSKQVLDATAYQAARAAMMTMTGDGQRKLGLMPKLLICGPSNEAAAKNLLQADMLANGATNIYKGTAKLVVSPYLP